LVVRCPNKGVFHEIVEPERLVITASAFEDEEGNPSFVSPSSWDNLKEK